VRSAEREDDSADLLADEGYDVEQLKQKSSAGTRQPDYRIEGEIFDNSAPSTDNARNILDRVAKKVGRAQADRIVLNLDDSAVSLDALRQELQRSPIDNLREIIVVRDGQLIPFFP
jgi:hypothetical protein